MARTTHSPPAIAFGCTACGRCCHGLRLPLSNAEARDWSAAGGMVELFCDAAPDLGQPADAAGRHRWASSFAAVSGTLVIRVRLTLVASFDGPCPRLLPDRRCGAYDQRPNACRIYPAELRPGHAIDPADKLCPPEAWGAAAPLLTDATGRIVDGDVAQAIAAVTADQHADAAAKAGLADALGLRDTALANEGSVILTPRGDTLRSAIDAAAADPVARPPVHGWRFSTASGSTATMIHDAGGVAVPADALATTRYQAY